MHSVSGSGKRKLQNPAGSRYLSRNLSTIM